MAKILELQSEIVCIFPGLRPVRLEFFSKGTGFDKEMKAKYSFPDVKETGSSKDTLERIEWEFGYRQEDGKVINVVGVRLENDRIVTTVAGNHASCDKLLEEIIELVTKYCTASLPLETSMRLYRTIVKVQTENDTSSFFTSEFLEVLNSMAKSVYPDHQLLTETHPYGVAFAFMFRSEVPPSQIKDADRSKLNVLTMNPRAFNIVTAGAGEFYSKMFTMEAPLRSETFMQFIEKMEKLTAK